MPSRMILLEYRGTCLSSSYLPDKTVNVSLQLQFSLCFPSTGSNCGFNLLFQPPLVHPSNSFLLLRPLLSFVPWIQRIELISPHHIEDAHL